MHRSRRGQFDMYLETKAVTRLREDTLYHGAIRYDSIRFDLVRTLLCSMKMLILN